jgi:hypothetical protein
MTDTPTDETDPLSFAFATAVVLGAWVAGSFVVNELLRRKRGDKEWERD